jgi:hypothetical protein
MKIFINGARYFVKGVDVCVEVQRVVLGKFQGVKAFVGIPLKHKIEVLQLDNDGEVTLDKFHYLFNEHGILEEKIHLV